MTRTVWAATTRNDAFIRMVGLSETINHPEHRKEIVAGDLAAFIVPGEEHLTRVCRSAYSGPSAFKQAVREAGDYANGFWETIRSHWNVEHSTPMRFTHDITSELPKVRLSTPTTMTMTITITNLYADRIRPPCRPIPRLHPRLARLPDAHHGDRLALLLDAADPRHPDGLHRGAV